MIKVGDSVVIITNSKGMYGVKGVVRHVDKWTDYCMVEFSYGCDECKLRDLQVIK